MVETQTSRIPANSPMLVLVFLLGFMIGGISLFCTDWLVFKKLFGMQVGKILDLDYLELKNGDSFWGWISSEDQKQFFIMMDNGSFPFTREEARRMELNVYARYFKKLI